MRFRHLRNEEGKLAATLASKVIQKGEIETFSGYPDGTGMVMFTIAKCNPKDNFNRKIGRAIAGGRLSCKRYHHHDYINWMNWNVPLVEMPEDGEDVYASMEGFMNGRPAAVEEKDVPVFLNLVRKYYNHKF